MKTADSPKKKDEKLFIRPDDDLDRQAAIQATVDAFLEFFAEQAEEKGNLDLARDLRSKIGKPHPRAPQRGENGEDNQAQQ